MLSSTFYMHIAERLFGEWSEFLTGHALSLDEEARPQQSAGRRTGNRRSSLAGLHSPEIDADIIPHGVGDGTAESGAVERQVASGKNAPAVAVP
jgi:hypothetical protein